MSGPNPAYRVALLVLNYNGKVFLKDCLDSLLAQSFKGFELFFIDNASTDGSAEFVERNYPQVTLIRNPVNGGVGAGFNIGIRRAVEAGFDYVGFLNPDVQLSDRWLEESVLTLQRHPQAEICAGMSEEREAMKIDSAGGMIINFPAGIFGGFLGGAKMAELPPRYRDDDFQVFFGLVTAMVARRTTFEKFGFFNERYFMYFEDIDFSWRVLLGGGEIWCNPKARLLHVGHGGKKDRKLKLKIIGRTEINLLTTYWNNLSLFSFLAVFPLLLLIRTVASLVYLFVSPRVAGVKLWHLAVFVAGLVSGRYAQGRREAQRRRQRSDVQVLRLNPQSIFSIGMPAQLFRAWMGFVRGSHRAQN